MKKKTIQKVISATAAKKITEVQKEMQKEEFVKKGFKAKKITFYNALDFLLTGVRR